MEGGLVCALCAEPYNMEEKRPKTLKCGHTFCLECLIRWHGKQGRIECPNDQSKYYEPVDTLPDNQAIKNMLMDLEVRCPRHKNTVAEFCLTHLALSCEQCPPHGPNCAAKSFVEDTNEITNVLIKVIDDIFRTIPMPSPKLKEAYEKRFRQKLAANVNLLYDLKDQSETLDSLKCHCGQIADVAFDSETYEGICQAHNPPTPTPAVKSIQGLSKEEVKDAVFSCFKATLRNVNYCSLSLEDLNFLSARPSVGVEALQLFGKQLHAKSTEAKADYARLPDTSFCPKCKGVILKSSGEIYLLPCNSKLHAICQTCANSLQGQVSVVCPLDGLIFSEKGLQRLPGAAPANPQPAAFNPAAMQAVYSQPQMYESQIGFPANPPGGQYQPPELANIGYGAQPMAPGSVFRPPGFPSGLPPGASPFASPPPFMSPNYSQGVLPAMPQGFPSGMPQGQGLPPAIPQGFQGMPQGFQGMPPSPYAQAYNPQPGAPMYQPQYAAPMPAANPQMFPQSAANLQKPPAAPVMPPVNSPTPSSSVQCSPLPPIDVQGQYILHRFPTVLPPAGISPASMTGNNKGWHVNFQKNQVEAVTMTSFVTCVLTGIGLANPIQAGVMAIVESVSLFNGPYAYGRPVAEHKGGEQLVGGNSLITYVNFRTGFQIPEYNKMTLKVKITCPPNQRVAGVDLYRGNPFDRPDMWFGTDESIWEFEETIKVGEGEFVNGQNNLSGPILRFIYRR